MITLQIGLIVFFLLILAIIYQEERRRRREERKPTKFNRVWPSGKERRKSVRLDTEIDVLYEVHSGKVSAKQSSLSRNISVGGINLALDEKLFPETTLSLQLNIPEVPRPIFAQGKIVWVKEISQKFIGEGKQRLFATGIQFTQVDKKDEVVLDNFIKQSIQKRQGEPLAQPLH